MSRVPVVMSVVHTVVPMRMVAVGMMSAVVAVGMVGRVHSGVFPLLMPVRGGGGRSGVDICDAVARRGRDERRPGRCRHDADGR